MAVKPRAKSTETPSGLIRTFRISNDLSQSKLGKKAGMTGKPRNTPISPYERGVVSLTIEHIYKISKCLPGLDRDTLFNFVLKERYQKFIDKEYKLYYNQSLKQRNYFYRKGKSTRTKYRLLRFSKLLREARIKKGVTYPQMIKSFQRRKNIKHKYSRPYLVSMINGHRCPSLKDIKYLAIYFNLDAFKLFSLAAEGKAISLARDMMEYWESYKKEKDNETEIVKFEEAYS